MMVWLNTTTGFIIGVCTVLTFLWAGWKWARPRLAEAKADRIAQRDAIIGRPAIKDSITGDELVPALPGIGQRMANTEQQMTSLAEAMTKLADSHQLINKIGQQVAANTEGLASHNERITVLEEMKGERVLSKFEQIQLLKTMDTALKSDPSKHNDGDD